MDGSDLHSCNRLGKSLAIRSMFSGISPRYNQLNSVLSLGMHRRWRRYAVRVAGVEPGQTAIDICCGTGDFAFDLAEAVGINGDVHAVDFCRPMLDIAEKRALAKGCNNIAFSKADALSLPFEEGRFACATVGFGIRNVAEPHKMLQEAYRVLAPGGVFVCLETSTVQSALIAPFWRVYFYKIAPIIASMFGGDAGAYRYLSESTSRFFMREELLDMLEEVGFVNCRHIDMMFGAICIHVGRKLE